MSEEYYDDILDIKKDIYLRVADTKRVTYGEHLGEPKNGFEITLQNGERITIDLSGCDILIKKK